MEKKDRSEENLSDTENCHAVEALEPDKSAKQSTFSAIVSYVFFVILSGLQISASAAFLIIETTSKSVPTGRHDLLASIIAFFGFSLFFAVIAIAASLLYVYLLLRLQNVENLWQRYLPFMIIVFTSPLITGIIFLVGILVSSSF